MEAPMVVRLEIDRMRHVIMTAFSKYTEGLQSDVDEAVKHAIERFDFNGEVEAMAASLLRKTIKDSLETAMRTLTWDTALRVALSKHLVKELSRISKETET